MNKPGEVLTAETFKDFSYLDLVEMHDDLQKWLQVWHARCEELQEEIKLRIEEGLETK
jgi:hypothetical protein